MANKSQRHRKKRAIPSKNALAGVKVLEYASFVADPFCTNLLADLGMPSAEIDQLVAEKIVY
jgi:crotonobetainyl-CoA:carnitine CoA-transferase CaiB-like acyl-CoA transferase